MRTSPVIGALCGLLAASVAHGNTTPQAPSLSYLGTLNLTLAPPIAVGVGPLGDRNFFAITGGSFAGPVLSATVPGVGGDWGLGDPLAGNFKVEARYHLRTADGANIYGQSEGPQQGTLTHTRIKFETGHPNYQWLNTAVAVGIGSSDPELKWTAIEMWQLESPKPEGKGKGKERRRRM
ncbi:hypothetical protein QBC34DRAFT_329943 [Podospora aff. communis PSN243]|uniref:Uncharacterized protein n=1 Tax=Podospora aff. communis PSN243 TaxID=3040156 RepID=A0AAV9GFQ8_9PEZI|nr:hypothetical protein QBC34DRAFT_329943 [Podospora aff. communis PSN243]